MNTRFHKLIEDNRRRREEELMILACTADVVRYVIIGHWEHVYWVTEKKRYQWWNPSHWFRTKYWDKPEWFTDEM